MHTEIARCRKAMLRTKLWGNGLLREQYRNREEGKHSSLTDGRLNKLENVGFTWILNKSKRDAPAAAIAAGAMAAAGTDVVNIHPYPQEQTVPAQKRQKN